MQFSNISELDLAKIFVWSKKEKIEKLLGVRDLDTRTALEIICDFIVKNHTNFWTINENKYAPLFDEVFFYDAVNELKSAMENGINLDGGLRFPEPNIRFVS